MKSAENGGVKNDGQNSSFNDLVKGSTTSIKNIKRQSI